MTTGGPGRSGRGCSSGTDHLYPARAKSVVMYHQLISCRARVPIGERGAREQAVGGRATRAVIDARAVHHITSVSPYSFVASTGEMSMMTFILPLSVRAIDARHTNHLVRSCRERPYLRIDTYNYHQAEMRG